VEDLYTLSPIQLVRNWLATLTIIDPNFVFNLRSAPDISWKVIGLKTLPQEGTATAVRISKNRLTNGGRLVKAIGYEVSFKPLEAELGELVIMTGEGDSKKVIARFDLDPYEVAPPAPPRIVIPVVAQPDPDQRQLIAETVAAALKADRAAEREAARLEAEERALPAPRDADLDDDYARKAAADAKARRFPLAVAGAIVAGLVLLALAVWAGSALSGDPAPAPTAPAESAMGVVPVPAP